MPCQQQYVAHVVDPVAINCQIHATAQRRARGRHQFRHACQFGQAQAAGGEIMAHFVGGVIDVELDGIEPLGSGLACPCGPTLRCVCHVDAASHVGVETDSVAIGPA